MPKMKRNANGSGTIYKRSDGRWEGKYSVAATDGSGKYIRKSVYGKTQEEVRKKMTAISGEIDNGTYVAPSKMNLGEWMDTWLDLYVQTSVKPKTLVAYSSICDTHIKPALGNIALKKLTTTQIQRFYNQLITGGKVSEKTVKNIHGVLHRALEQAYLIGEIKINPSKMCSLPKVKKPKIVPFESKDVSRFLSAIKGHQFERIYYLTVFTGLRLGEVLGLTWDCVDLKNGTILINKQLRRDPYAEEPYGLDSTKSGRERTIAIAPAIVSLLQEQETWQKEAAEIAGHIWNNKWNLVFTNEVGDHLCHETVYRNYKRIVRKLGLSNKRFHDLRHTYAVASLESGDDIKTVQDNLGHTTASFTLDVYGHVSNTMKRRSAMNMQQYIDKVS